MDGIEAYIARVGNVQRYITDYEGFQPVPGVTYLAERDDGTVVEVDGSEVRDPSVTRTGSIDLAAAAARMRGE